MLTRINRHGLQCRERSSVHNSDRVKGVSGQNGRVQYGPDYLCVNFTPDALFFCVSFSVLFEPSSKLTGWTFYLVLLPVIIILGRFSVLMRLGRRKVARSFSIWTTGQLCPGMGHGNTLWQFFRVGSNSVTAADVSVLGIELWRCRKLSCTDAPVFYDGGR